jgi:hypothetical protein
LETSDKIEGLIGKHFSAHARVGDLVFKKHAEENMKILFDDLVQLIFDYEKEGGVAPFAGKSVEEVQKELWENGIERQRNLLNATREANRMSKMRRSFDTKNDEEPNSIWSDLDEPMENVSKRSLVSPPLPRKPLRPRIPQESPTLSPLLQCHQNLHTSPQLSLFNTPFYLATDSRSPSTDPNLSIFYSTFPCIFTYSDFVKLEASGQAELGIRKIERLTSEVDGVSIGGFMIGILEALGAAKGSVVSTTQTSTFGQYIQYVLHPYFMSLAQEH